MRINLSNSFVKKMLKLFLAFILLFLVSCKSTKLQELDLQALPQTSLQFLVDLNMQFTPKITKEVVTDVLGDPIKIDEFPFPNHHVRGQVDTVRIFYYEGLEISVYELYDASKAFITDIHISSPIYDAALDVRVGSVQADVIALLGQPENSTAKSATYVLSDSGDSLILFYENNQVTTMIWRFYWD